MIALLLLLGAAPPEGAVRVLYPLHGPELDFELLSVHSGVAVVWRDGRAYAVDVETGVVTEPGPAPRKDYMRWSTLVGPGPWWNRDYQPRTQMVGATGNVAVRDGEALVLVDPLGTPLERIVDEYNLDQKERLSPDGSYVAYFRFLGATGRFSLLASPIPYDDPLKVRVADGQGYPMAGPLWNAEGTALYFTSIVDHEVCLFRGDLGYFLEMWSLDCGIGQGGSLVMSPDGLTAAFLVHKNTAAAEAHWVDLPSGQVKAIQKVNVAGTRTTSLLLDNNGLLVVAGPRQKGLTIIDFVAAASTTLASGTYDGLGATDWVGPGQLVAIQHQGNEAAVVRIDARALIDAAH